MSDTVQTGAVGATIRLDLPEEEGRMVLPHYEYGLDVLALLGALRYQHHETVIEIHARGVSISQRNVT